MKARSEGSESLFRMVGVSWSQPRLMLLELAWRWVGGGFLLILIGLAARRIASEAGPAIAATGLWNQTLESAVQDPGQISVALASTLAILKPLVLHVAVGLAPLALFVWVLAFALGRTALLRRWNPRLPGRRWLLAVCEAARLLALVAVSAFWYAALQWAASYALGSATPDAPGAQPEPNLVLYCALVITITIGLFTLWSLLSWALLAAPLVAMLKQTSFAQGLAGAVRGRRARGGLVEVNLAMAVIKLGLIVLAMVMSATPLPFESIMQGTPLYAWWALVTLLYFAASDFFKVARLLSFLEQLGASSDLPEVGQRSGVGAEASWTRGV